MTKREDKNDESILLEKDILLYQDTAVEATDIKIGDIPIEQFIRNLKVDKREKIFLIFKAELDCLENDTNQTFMYVPFAFTESEEEAIEFCKKGRSFTKDNCWAIRYVFKDGVAPEFSYQEIPKI